MLGHKTKRDDGLVCRAGNGAAPGIQEPCSDFTPLMISLSHASETMDRLNDLGREAIAAAAEEA